MRTNPVGKKDNMTFSEEHLPAPSDDDWQEEDRTQYADLDLDSCVGRVRTYEKEQAARSDSISVLESLGVRGFNIAIRGGITDCGTLAACTDLELYAAVRKVLGERCTWDRFYRDLGELGEGREEARGHIQNAIYRDDERAAGIDGGE